MSSPRVLRRPTEFLILGASVFSATRALAVDSCGTWNQVATGGPLGRSGAGIAFNENCRRVVLFGGAGDNNSSARTWEWDGATWTQSPALGPAARWSMALGYDPTRRVVVLFGGLNFDLPEPYFADTWEYDGVNWTERLPSTKPTPRAHARFAYDLARADLILFGGFNDGLRSNETWRWDGADWVLLATSGPSPRSISGLTYDTLRERVVLFGGFDGIDQGDTWEWDGIRWELHATSGPSPRFWSALAYDERRGRTVLFGGFASSQFLGDTWEWDGITWTQREPKDSPTPRQMPAMVFSPLNDRVLLWSGFTGGGGTIPQDTWLWNAEPALISQQPVALSLAPGDTGVFSVTATGIGDIAYRWSKDEVPLEDDDRIAGAYTSLLTINDVSLTDAGAYSATLVDDCSTVVSESADLLVVDCPVPLAACARSDVSPIGGDCIVSLGDLGVVLSNWTGPGTGCNKSRDEGDIYPINGGDGCVDLRDLGQILTDYGSDCR